MKSVELYFFDIIYIYTTVYIFYNTNCCVVSSVITYYFGLFAVQTNTQIIWQTARWYYTRVRELSHSLYVLWFGPNNYALL